MIYCGIDWAERTHDVALVDDSGQLLAKRHITDDAAGYKILLDLLVEFGDSEENPIPVAIETSRGLLVAVLRTGRRQVFAINLGQAAAASLRPVRPGRSRVPKFGGPADEFSEPVDSRAGVAATPDPGGCKGIVAVVGPFLEVRYSRSAGEGLRQQPLRLLLPGATRDAEDALALLHEQLGGPEQFVVIQVQTHSDIITHQRPAWGSAVGHRVV